MTVFINQALLLTLETGKDLTTASVTRINYVDPNGEEGYFTASVVNTTQVQYQITDTDISVVGHWKFQAFATISSQDYFGVIVKLKFNEPL